MTPNDDYPADAPLIEGEDYTVDDGRWVFTAAFLRRRGYCCNNGCRHCPYDDPPPGDGGAVEPPAGH